MPLLDVDHGCCGLTAARQAAALDRALAEARPGTPVLIMIHGFRYAPGRPDSDPHRAIFALDPALAGPRVVSWPQQMGLRAQDDPGLVAIGFGWRGDGTFRDALARARAAGEWLALLIRRIRAVAPAARVGLLAHSLGARVVLTALPALDAGDVHRAVLMAASECRRTAARTLATPAGRIAEILNVTSRENALFDLLAELAGGAAPGQALGRGLARDPAAVPSNWIDLRIDEEATRSALWRIGHRLPAPDRRICHWSAFSRPGLFPFYRAILTDPEPLSFGNLRAALQAARGGGAGDREVAPAAAGSAHAPTGA